MMKKLIACMLGIVCVSLAGCVLESIEERGDICPPGHLKNSAEGRHVVFANMDCYEDYVLFSSDMSDFAKSCGECSELEDGSGQWKCNGNLMPCLSSGYERLKQNYVHCKHYRDHGVLAEGSDVNLEIAFVRDYYGTAVTPEELASYKSSNSCPIKYDVCTYDESYTDKLNPDEIMGAYGCVQSCSGTLLYCGKDNQRHCVNPMNDSEYCGAKGDCSNPDQMSANWHGIACENGMICQDGSCVCGEGFKTCGKNKNCVDILHSPEHCGESCEACGSNEVCMNGACVPYECDEPGLCSNDRHRCKNTKEACGESCIDCLALPNVDEADCDKTGVCVIQSCQENFHLELNEITQDYECRKNTIESCAPRDAVGDDVVRNCTEIPESKEVVCGSDGQCIVKACKYGFAVSQGQTQCVEEACADCDEYSEVCYMGTCQCKAGWVSCGENGGGCTDIINDLHNCGECGKTCLFEETIDHALDVGCYYAKCGVTACEDHFHPNGMECELNTPENCGEHGKNCAEIANVVDATCDEEAGKCIIDSCEPGYHVYAEKAICEEDTDLDCNEHEHSCWVDNAVDVECVQDETGTQAYCVTKACEDGYHLAPDPEDPEAPEICQIDDEEHCGAPDVKCQENAYCVKTEEGYVCECDAAYVDCGGVCVNDFDSNKNYCGGCSIQCKDYQDCITGNCGCVSGTDCDSKCADLQTDKEHCGKCGAACKDYQDCITGSCGCVSGTDCGSKCADLQTDKEHCGDCGTACKAHLECITGICSCTSGTDCGSSCVDLQSDKSNCGSCGNKCKDYQACISGKCGCTSNTDCGSSCVDLQSDKDNCGTCGNKCKDHLRCLSGKCSCKSGTDCGSSCVDLQSDKNNCGSC
ncbi:MAG: hypothetical protein J6A01_11960, partial [Proteobacteria bacterium]|nr:hypothetical protein [Pseudomonadota bacterium]